MEEKINKKPAYILMTVLVMLWGFDYVVAKTGLEVFKPMSLLFCKYGISRHRPRQFAGSYFGVDPRRYFLFLRYLEKAEDQGKL